MIVYVLSERRCDHFFLFVPVSAAFESGYLQDGNPIRGGRG